VGADHLQHLIPDPVYRIQGRHGLLEDHGDLISPDLSHSGFRRLHQILSIKKDLTVLVNDTYSRGDQPQDRRSCHALSTSGFSHDAYDLSLIQGKFHVFHCCQLLFSDVERNL